MNNKILIVDDEPLVILTVKKKLENLGYTILTANNGKEALNSVRNDNPTLVLLDYQLPNTDGLTLLQEINKINSSITVIMLTAYANISNAVKAMKLGAYDYLEKVRDIEKLPIIINNAFEKISLKQKVLNFEEEKRDKTLTELMGDSTHIQKIIKQVQLIGPTDMSVFLEGETGTGKNLVAEHVHKQSMRSGKVFLSIDCGAIPDTLFESEMFGHEKGSFTGAVAQHKGVFEQANGGTLFLDEISNIPLHLQTKLLRAIQERTITRIGGTKKIQVDVRIIAASNRDMEQEVTNGKFKDDLFYRLNEFSIRIPSLRQRADDIPTIASNFLLESNRQLNKSIKSISNAALNKLLVYEWPGNVRELKNVIKKAVLLEPGDQLMPESLNLRTHGKPKESTDAMEITAISRNAKMENIQRALRITNGNKTQAAKIVGISRRQLYRYLEKFETNTMSN